MRAICLCFIFISLPNALFAISCLVTRPGYGFTSEACPTAAVGCRIKARSDHVEWYEWSKLYDRNQLVCVYPGEYEGIAGCVRKHSGNVRCWCGGTDDCNNPETSRELLDAFQKSDRKKMQMIVRRLEMGANQGEEVIAETTTEAPTTTTTTTATTTTTTTAKTTIRTRLTKPPTRKHTHKKHSHKTPRPIIQTTTTTTPTTTPTTSPTTTITRTTTEAISNDIESVNEALPLPTESELGDTFDETRRRLNEEMREEDERLQQLLADEEAEMSRDQEDNTEERDEQRRRDRERNRMERRERARADEKRRMTEEETLRKHEKAQKHREVLPSSEEIDDDYENSESSITTTISLITSIFSLLVVLMR